MKRKIYLILTLLAIIFVACKKDKTENPYDVPYSDKPVTETKKDIDSTGVLMVNQMESLNQEPGMEAVINLLLLLTESNNMLVGGTPAETTLKALAAYNKKADVGIIINSLKSIKSDDPGLLDIFDTIKGEYAYDFIGKGIAKIGESDDLILRFPATLTAKNSENNNGILTIKRPEVITGSFNFGDTVTTELPTLFQFDIKVNNVEAITYEFTGAYNSDGIPTSIVSTLTISTFEFKYTFGYSSASLDMNYSIKHGTTIIVDIGGGINGNFDKQNLEEISDQADPDPTKVLYNANAHFQFMNIKIAGQIDFKDLYTKITDIDEQEYNGSITNDEAADKRVSVINSEAVLICVYADNNTMIAKTEAYAKPSDDIYNPGKDVDMRLIFADKSKNSLDEYFKQGFDDLIVDFENFVTELQTKYGLSSQPPAK